MYASNNTPSYTHVSSYVVRRVHPLGFLEPHRTTYHSNIGIHLGYGIELDMPTLTWMVALLLVPPHKVHMELQY